MLYMRLIFPESVVLRAAVQAVYATNTRRQPDTSGNAYKLACFYDFRPLFIIQAAVNHTNRSQEQTFQGSRENARRTRRRNVSGSTLAG